MDDIKTGRFKKAYLIFGNEPYLIREARLLLEKALVGDDTMNTLTVRDRTASPEEVRDFTDTMPFFADRRVVILENSGLFGKEDPKYSEWIETLPDTAVVLFSEAPEEDKTTKKMKSSVDKRSKLFKAVQKEGTVVELNAMEGEAYSDWLLKQIGKRKLKITKKAFQLLSESLPDSMEASLNELDKLADYVGADGAVDEAAVRDILTPKLENQVFKLVEAAISKDRKTAFDLYYDLLALKEYPMKILSLIEKELVSFCTVASMRRDNASIQEIASAIGRQEFVAKKLVSKAERIPVSFIEEKLEKALELDKAVKSGDLSDSMAVELLLFHLT